MEDIMKRKLSLLITIIMIATIIISGCGGKDTKNTAGTTGTADTTDTANKEEYLIRVAHVLPEEHATHITLKEVFINTDDEINKGMEQIEGVTEKFMDTQMQIETIASASEQSAASIEEVLATIENQNEQIMSINDSIKEINAMCIKLKEMADLK